MKVRYLKFKDWLLMTAMSLLGLASCHSSKEIAKAESSNTSDDNKIETPTPRNEIALMYGVPTMDYVVKGRVINPDGQPVEGMQVILVNQRIDIAPEYMQEDNPRVLDYIHQSSDTTNSQGYFQCQVSDVPVQHQRIIVRDIDGEANGRYQDQMIEVSFRSEDQTKQGSGWYQGTRTKDVDITVREK